jgi:hypothetical protein
LQELKARQEAAAGPDPAYSVRFFEQAGNQRVELEDDGSFEQSLSGMDASALKTIFSEMKSILGTQQEKDALDEVISQMGGIWDRMRTTDDVGAVVSNMEEYDAKLDAQIESTLEELPEELRESLRERFAALVPRHKALAPRETTPQIPLEHWTLNQRKKIARLNTQIRRVTHELRTGGKLTDKSVVAVYRAYHTARLSLASAWAHVPIAVWDFLWDVFSADESINVHRLSHISSLARDMSEAKVILNPAQQLLTIEAVFVDGWESKAIDNWKRCMSSLGDGGADTFQSFWELGVRMYCRTGDLDQAQRAVDKLLQQNSDPRILMPIIRTRSERGTAEDQESAWLAYRRMRELLGQSITLSDYDQVISYFLTANQTENALYAFVDMMSDGQIDLKKQKSMPSVVANKFFLGKWLKRLIGAGDLDGAHNVIEFMREKGVQAAPIHVNGLIGAWHRSGGAENADKAEALAWKLIEMRIKFVAARKAGKGSSFLNSVMVPAPYPRATLETFSVLAENYRVRGLHDQMGGLWDAFKEAEISPDAFMMNQLLESHIQAGQPGLAVDLYESLVQDRGVSPDSYTFSALWKTLGVNRLHIVSEDNRWEEVGATRRLFSETVKFRALFQPSGMDGQLARKILHSFRRVKDIAGFLVALTSLKQLFGFLPSETLVMEMMLGTMKLSLDNTAQRRRLMLAKRSMDEELMAWANHDAAKLEGERRGVALYEYLQNKMWPEVGSADASKVFIDASKEMGVYEALVPKKNGVSRL